MIFKEERFIFFTLQGSLNLLQPVNRQSFAIDNLMEQGIYCIDSFICLMSYGKIIPKIDVK